MRIVILTNYSIGFSREYYEIDDSYCDKSPKDILMKLAMDEDEIRKGFIEHIKKILDDIIYLSNGLSLDRNRSIREQIGGCDNTTQIVIMHEIMGG